MGDSFQKKLPPSRVNLVLETEKDNELKDNKNKRKMSLWKQIQHLFKKKKTT